MFKKVVLLAAVVIFSSTASAAYISTQSTTISFLASHNAYGGGDVTFKVTHPLAECPGGFWLSSTDPGFPANISMLISAYQHRTGLIISALPDQPWAGSTSVHCKLYSIEFQ